MNFAKLFGFKNNDQTEHKQLGTLFAAIEKMMTDRPIMEVKLVTGWAGLLGKVAYADMDLDDKEIAKIREIISGTHGIGTRAASSIADLIIKERAVLLSIEDHLYTRMINEVADVEQKKELLDTLYRVASADDTIRETEDATIRMISHSLQFSHKEFIEVRRRFKDKLAVFQS